MFKSLLGLAGDVAKTVVTPVAAVVEVAADAARIVTKPVAEAVEEVTTDLSKILK